MATLEVLLVFLRLGLTSFGGPVAHLGYFREAFVVRRRWIDEAGYADLVALCQFLPGPASSQVGFALGLKRAGLAGACAAWLGFTAPSAALMLAVAYGADTFATPTGQAVAHGLKLVAVAVVAHAVFGMARSLCTDWTTRALAVAATAATLAVATAWAAPAIIAAAGLVCLALAARAPAAPVPPVAATNPAWAPLALFAALLVALPLLAPQGGAYAIADAFYRAGALVFGGGHVVLPLLDAETVGRGWLDAEAFLAGYGAAQAVPGPLFTFAAYLGAAGGPMPGWTGGLVALVAVFAPGLLLVLAALPWWERLKAMPRARGFVRGANAAVVGVLAAALWSPVIATGVRGWPDALVAAAGFALLQWAKAPAWLVVILVAGAGMALALPAGGVLAIPLPDLIKGAP
jgi:chromate transporter